MAPKLLVTGISGFLGWHITQQKQNSWEIIGTYHNNNPTFKNIKTIQVDLTNSKNVISLFEKIKPDAVLHLAAISNANFCEQNPSHSKKVNVDASLHLAQLCKKRNIPFIFTSTDLVFDGVDAPYSEEDPISPICIYGQQKVLAEQRILSLYKDATIVRLPLMYGIAKTAKSFFSSWMEQFKLKNNVFAFADEYRTTLSAYAAVEGLFLILNNREKGIWHLGGKERISRYDFGAKMIKQFGFQKELLKSSLQKDVTMPAARPPDVSFDSSKIYAIGFDPPFIDIALKRIFDQM